jgi:nitroreductase/NAD-dependent dihydropyrimidine dehydrogenase PreA subunit
MRFTMSKIPNITPSINSDKCTLCGACVKACPKEIIQIQNKKIILIPENDCIMCTHCYSVCKPKAVTFQGSIKNLAFNSIKYREKYIEPGNYNPNAFINFARSRRSTRKFKEKSVPINLLRDLAEFAVSAPSASNCQIWEFTIVNGREKVLLIAKDIMKFMIKLNKIAKNPAARYISVLFAGRAILDYYQNKIKSVEKAIADFQNKGKDRLFHGAPSLIVIHSEMSGSMPEFDAQYAAYNITLLAHALELGTCFIGYASETIKRIPSLKQYLRIPRQNMVHAVIAVGYPDVKYLRPTLRKNYRIEII